MKGLTIDRWFKVFVYIGVLAFAISLIVEVKGITNRELQMISLGLFFVGIGEWKNEKYLSYIRPPNVYTGPAALVQTPVRKADSLGIAFDAVGGILLLAGIAHVVWTSFVGS